jgi:predicted transposase YbfD/YdcC
VIEVERKVKHLRAGEVVKETHEFEYAATNLSPRRANAKVLDKLLRRHWMIENRNHYVRDNHWNEDRQTWRSGSSAFVMFVLVSIAMNLLRAAPPCWTELTWMPGRSMAVDYTLTAAPETVLRKPP